MDQCKRILIVDDDRTVLFVLGEILREMDEGYDVSTAQDGDQALHKLGETPFDLVITDLKMPGMGGVELTEEVRALTPNTKVIWITAYGYDRMRPEAERLAVYRCIDKPAEPSTIRRTVLDALQGDRSITLDAE